MGARLARRHFLEQKNALDSVDGVSRSQKMRSTQSTAFPGAKKCARLSRRRFLEPKNVLDSVDGVSRSQKMCSTQSTERHRAETEGKRIFSPRQKKKVMKNLLKFQPPKSARLNVAEYTNFINRFRKITIGAGIGVVHYEQADMDRLVQLHGLLVDNVKRNMAAAETASLQELEALRDEIGRIIIDSVKAGQSMRLPAIVEASKQLWYVLQPYNGFYALPNMQETTAIEGMLFDLSKGDCPTHLATLGLTDYVTQLADANNRYAALEAQRTVSNSDAKAPESKSIRTELDALYTYITDVAFAHQVLNPTSELARYIRDVNDMIAEVNAAYNQRMGQTKAQTESVPVPPPTTEPDSGTTPEPEPTPDPEPTPTPTPDNGEDDDDEGGLAG